MGRKMAQLLEAMAETRHLVVWWHEVGRAGTLLLVLQVASQEVARRVPTRVVVVVRLAPVCHRPMRKPLVVGVEATTDMAQAVPQGLPAPQSLPVLQTLVVEGMVDQPLALVRLAVPGMH